MIRKLVDRDRDDAGFALIAVILITAVLAVMVSAAFLDSSVSNDRVNGALVHSEADESANYGVAKVTYDMETGTFLCSYSSQQVALPTGSLNTYTTSWSTSTVQYFDSSGNSLDPSGTNCVSNVLQAVPTTATVAVTGSASSGIYQSSETINETLAVTSVNAQNMVIFSGGNVDLTKNVQITAPANSSTGELYSGGTISLPSGNCTNESVNTVSSGDTSIYCNITGEVDAVGNLNIYNSTVTGDVDASSGNLTMWGGTITGNATAAGSTGSGNITLCPNSDTCSGTKSTNNNEIKGTTTASGTVYAYTTQVANTTSPCPTNTQVLGQKFDSCITNSSGQKPTAASASYSYPTLTEPTSGTTGAWYSAGYTQFQTVACNSAALGAAMKSEVSATSPANGLVIDVIGCTGPLVLSTASMGGFSGTVTNDTAIFVPCGLIGANNWFKGGPTNAAQLSFIIPSNTTCSATGVGISGVSTSGASPNIVATITTSSAHGLSVGQQVTIASVNGASAVNGTWTVASVPANNKFTISMGSTAVAAYTSGGTVTPNTSINLVDSNFPNTLQEFVYTPVGDNVDVTTGKTTTMVGQIVTGVVGSSASAGITGTLKMTYAPFLTGPLSSRSTTAGAPGLAFGYYVSPTSRAISTVNSGN